jgi:anti-sigma regulatory factor (Ser/Thr protein kinase)
MTKLAVQLASTAQAPYEARVLIRERLAEVIPATTLWDLLTVVTELVTNAVRHGRGGSVRIRLIVGAIADRWRVFVGGSTRVRFELLRP